METIGVLILENGKMLSNQHHSRLQIIDVLKKAGHVIYNHLIESKTQPFEWLRSFEDYSWQPDFSKILKTGVFDEEVPESNPCVDYTRVRVPACSDIWIAEDYTIFWKEAYGSIYYCIEYTDSIKEVYGEKIEYGIIEEGRATVDGKKNIKYHKEK